MENKYQVTYQLQGIEGMVTKDFSNEDAAETTYRDLARKLTIEAIETPGTYGIVTLMKIGDSDNEIMKIIRIDSQK